MFVPAEASEESLLARRSPDVETSCVELFMLCAEIALIVANMVYVHHHHNQLTQRRQLGHSLVFQYIFVAPDGAGRLELQSALRGNESVALIGRHLSAGVMQIAPLYDRLRHIDITDDLWEPINHIAAYRYRCTRACDQKQKTRRLLDID